MFECLICGANNSQGASKCARCGAPLVSIFLPVGAKLYGGAYTVGKVLGQGGFGITYMGSDVRLRRPVAIKEFFPSGCVRHGIQVSLASPHLTPADFSGLRQRFVQEARVVARFNHPSIVKVYDVFEENNTAYMVMEYLRGESLQKIVQKRGGKLTEQEALGYAVQLCEALEVVHRSGVIHRDIKPDNIIVCEDGRVVLLDFGAAREFASRTVRRQTVIYTPGFAPPEQYTEIAERGPFTDVYALAATLYFILTGEMPTSAPDRRLGYPLVDIRQLNPNLSVAVAEAIMRGLELEARQRPQTSREFLSLLQEPHGAQPPHAGVPDASREVAEELRRIPSNLQNVLSRLYLLNDKIRQENMLIDHFYISTLEKGIVETRTYALQQGNTYLVAGSGDDEAVTDLDARICAPNGKVMGEDTMRDNTPAVRFRAPVSGLYQMEVWDGTMKASEGYYTLAVGHVVSSADERRMMSVWEGIFERALGLILVAAAAGYRTVYAELDTVREGYISSLDMVMKAGDYFIVATGDEVHIADLDLVVELPNGQKIEDREPDNVPQATFRLEREEPVKISVVAARMHNKHDKGYYALFIGKVMRQ